MDWSPPQRPAVRSAGFVEPCIPTLAERPPTGPLWVHEIKHDGFRLMVWREGERVRLFTRRGYDWTEGFPWIEHSARRLRVTRFLIEGEAVVCGEDGVSDFEKLHSGAHDASVLLYRFDLLVVDGTDMRPERLDDRRAKLRQLLVHLDGIRFSGHAGDGEVVFRHACNIKLGLEGVVSKRRDSHLPVRSQQGVVKGKR